MRTELYQPRPYAQRGVNPARLAAVKKYAGSSVIDVGCGNGVYVLNLKDQFDIHGVDWQKFDSWSTAPERFQVADGSRLPFPNERFDTVLSFECLEHLESPESAIVEYHRVCKKNLILTVPNCDISVGMRMSGLLYSHWGDPTHRNFFNLSNVTQLINNHGFKVVSASYINPINPFPFVAEALNLRGKFWQKLYRSLFPQKSECYFLTCLIVAEKKPH